MHANVKCHSVCSDMTNKEDVKKKPKKTKNPQTIRTVALVCHQIKVKLSLLINNYPTKITYKFGNQSCRSGQNIKTKII